MQQAPSEVFHYTDSRGHSDAILLSKSCTILQAAKRDLLGLLQLQDPGLLEGRVTLHHVKAGSVVARQGDQVARPGPARPSGERSPVSSCCSPASLHVTSV